MPDKATLPIYIKTLTIAVLNLSLLFPNNGFAFCTATRYHHFSSELLHIIRKMEELNTLWYQNEVVVSRPEVSIVRMIKI